MNEYLSRTEKSNLSPSEFMRNLHPELFSDSVIDDSLSLSREVFEYTLDTLTSRKQELDFEHFCRKLVEKDICPNLIPQTGPIGGGDSQVDTETYPVSDITALNWYEGIGREASYERWAFAISAKKTWRAKVDSDIKKIVDTKREYRLAYFITNQFISDKTRAQVEGSLQKKYGIEVRILDRSWIVDRVFDHDRLWLAIDTLHISGFKKEEITRKGPFDTQRETRLKELEEQIVDQDRYLGVEYQKAEDCYEAALLARELERPQVEVEGRFQRAIDIANKVNINAQKLQILYNYAWTEYWWYEAYDSFNHLYDEVEKLAVGSPQADDIQLLLNLWELLLPAVNNGHINTEDGRIQNRIQTIKTELNRLIEDEKRPNNALQARTYLLLIELIEALHQNVNADKIFDKFIEVINKSTGLIDYPILSTLKILQELGPHFTNSPKYDELLDITIDITGKRTSEGYSGLALLKRGEQLLQSGHNYEAIKYFGRAQLILAKNEYKSDWITSIVFCGIAYENVGLLWAARTNLLMATNQALKEFSKHGNIKVQTINYVQKLFWLEIKLGRLPYALAWLEFASSILPFLVSNDDFYRNYQSELNSEDQALATLIMKFDFYDLISVDFFPAVLKEMGLNAAWVTLMYVLGYEDQLRKEKLIPDDIDSAKVRDLFSKLYDQPLYKELPDKPDILCDPVLKLVSPVMGSKIVINTPNENIYLFLAESIIGSLEAFLATSSVSDLIPYRSELNIVIEASDSLMILPEYSINERQQGEVLFRCPDSLSMSNSSERETYNDWLLKLVADITSQIVTVPNVETFIERVIKDDKSLERALAFSNIGISILNILGEHPKIRLSDWKRINVGERYPLQRAVPWNIDLQRNAEEVEEMLIQPDEDGSPSYLSDLDQLSHKDRKVISLINIPIWDQAKWVAMGFVCTGNEPPTLALCFKNPDAANIIFSEWQEQLGNNDEENKLRVVIITGIRKRLPNNYKILISSNLSPDKFIDHKFILSPSRCLEMYPQSSTNLQSFLSAYKRVGRYILVPSVTDIENNMPIRIGDHLLEKSEIIVRQAWEIGPNDPDVVAIQKDDDPIIPEGIIDAPVIFSLKRFEKNKGRKRHNKCD